MKLAHCSKMAQPYVATKFWSPVPALGNFRIVFQHAHTAPSNMHADTRKK